MKPFNIAIIDDERCPSEELRKKLEEKCGILDDVNIEYIVWEENFEGNLTGSQLLNINPQVRSDMIILSYHLSKNLGIRIAKEIKENNPFTPVILATNKNVEFDEYDQEKIDDAFADYKIDDVIRIPCTSERIQTKVRKKMQRALKIGIFGLGRLGRAVLKKTKESDCIEKIHVYTSFAKYVQEAKPMIIRLVGENNLEKVEFHDNLEEMVNADHDVLLITTGRHIADSEKVFSRDHEFEESMNKISQLVKYLKQYQGMVISESNPVELILNELKDSVQNNKRLTSISADSFRAKTMLFKGIKMIPPYYHLGSANDIFLEVMGKHGHSIPLFEECILKIKDPEKEEQFVYRYLKDIYPSVLSKYFRDRFSKRLDKIGERTMQASLFLKDSYEDTPHVIMQGLEDIAGYKKRLRPSFHCYFGEKQGFLIYPARMDYKNFEIKPVFKFNKDEKEKEINDFLIKVGKEPEK